jgi:hypothetical protein
MQKLILCLILIASDAEADRLSGDHLHHITWLGVVGAIVLLFIFAFLKGPPLAERQTQSLDIVPIAERKAPIHFSAEDPELDSPLPGYDIQMDESGIHFNATLFSRGTSELIRSGALQQRMGYLVADWKKIQSWSLVDGNHEIRFDEGSLQLPRRFFRSRESEFLHALRTFIPAKMR